MDTPQPVPLPKKYSPLSDEEIEQAKENLVRCLDALDQRGEAGLQEELNRIYPLSLAEDDGRPIDLHPVLSTPIPGVRRKPGQEAPTE
jgi:hypothetical protein